MSKSSVLLAVGLLVAGGMVLSIFIYFSQNASTESGDASGGEKAPSVGAVSYAEPAAYPNILTFMPRAYEPKSAAETIIYPQLLHLPLRIHPLKHERLSDPGSQNLLTAIISNYEHKNCDLVKFAERNNKESRYVSARDDSIAAFFQLVSSKVVDTLCYQKANNVEPVSLDDNCADCDDLYLSDETGDFKNFLTVYHEKANGELRGLVLTVEEWARARQILNALTPSTVVREVAANKELLHKLVFSRNIYALAHPLFKAIPETAAAGDSDVDEGAEDVEAVDGDSMQKLFNLVALLHNITSDGAVLEPGDKMDYLLFASLLYPFRLHYKELDSLEDVKVVASCCRSPGSDMNVYPTYLFRWEEIGLPQGYGDNYHLFSYRVIYELTRPLIESIRRSSLERAEVCAREFESIRLVENFDPSSDGNALDEFFKSLKGKRNFTPQADMVLFIVDRRFGYIRACAQGQ